MSVLRRGFVIMIGRIHQSDSMTIQIEVVVKEPALAQKLPRSQFDGRGPMYEHDFDWRGSIRWRCTRPPPGRKIDFSRVRAAAKDALWALDFFAVQTGKSVWLQALLIIEI
jgi:hypothetical protein